MEQQTELDGCKQRGKDILHALQEYRHQNVFSDKSDWLGASVRMNLQDFALYHIQELTFEEKAPRREAMENILASFRGITGVNFLYLILGDKDDVKFYFGVAKDYSPHAQDMLNVVDIGDDILAPGIRGNFRGCTICDVGEEGSKAKEDILKKLCSFQEAGCLFGVPGTVEEQEGFQGVDRLIDVMAGDRFGFLLIARPYVEAEIDKIERALLSVSDALMPLARHTVQQSHSKGSATNEGRTISHNTQVGSSVDKSKSNNKSEVENQTHDIRQDMSNTSQSSTTSSAAESSDTCDRFDANQQNDKEIAKNARESSSKTYGQSTSKNHNVQEQVNDSYSQSVAKSESTSTATSTNISVGETSQESESKSYAKNESHEKSTSSNDNTTRTESLEVEAKEATEWVKYIDEVLLPRLDYGRGKGLFLTCAYLFANVPAVLRRLAHTATALYSGPKGNRAALSFYLMKKSDETCKKMLQNMQLPVKSIQANTTYSSEVAAVLERSISYPAYVFGGNWLSARELSVFAALPQKEVPGLALREEVDFGLNPKALGGDIPESERLEIGQLVQNGLKTESPVFFDKRELNKHLFITGVTGSGKTTTCQHILTEWGGGENPRPFLVIEPAKTEYRVLKNRGVIFFTPGQQDIAPFYLNPFELFPGEKITARADMLKATFTASFEMEAAIPQIFETAIYRVYEEKGWDINTNLWNRKKEDAEDGPFADGVYAFPTLSDFLKATEEVTNKSGFDDRLKNDYNGSIKARLTSLLVGAKGMMLNTRRSIDFRDLVNRCVVIELEEIKSGEEKSLLMGFILINLMQAIRSEHQKNSHFRHITLVEEAHRLLSRYEPGDSMNKKQGVGVFADMLAEVRKYGESLMIADQIPEKMVPDVLKNTNTKIVHKIFAKDDKEAIGDTMALDDDQKSFLSKLPAGRAIMLTQGWSRAVQVQVKNTTDTSQAEIQSEELREIAIRYYAEESVWKRGVLFGSERTNVTPTPEIAKEYLWLMLNGGELIKQYKNFMQAGDSTEENIKSLKEEIELVSQNARDELWQTYLVSYAYQEKSYDRDRDELAIEFLKKVRTGQWTHEEYHDTKFRALKN
ncbi:MAG: DUF87 domain-containing protein [Acetobacter sp.]|nr:DUF87 domain-containing protein [Acetobacter sp.]